MIGSHTFISSADPLSNHSPYMIKLPPNYGVLDEIAVYRAVRPSLVFMPKVGATTIIDIDLMPYLRKYHNCGLLSDDSVYSLYPELVIYPALVAF